MHELAAVTNPFRESVVQRAWDTPTDVPDIHAGAFAACLRGIESASRGVPDSLLVYGPAGSGKTHLLTRLQRHLKSVAAPQAPDAALRCVFVYVRLQTSAWMIWQHVRGRLAADLMLKEEGVSQLQRLVAHQLGTQTGRSPRSLVRELRIMGQADQSAASEHLHAVAERLQLPRDLTIVLDHLVCNRHVRDASAWLRGESLHELTLHTLGLGSEGDEDREQAAAQVVTSLTRLAGETLPIVYCFDQVEALQQHTGDTDSVFRFGRCAADLHDADKNTFLITCLQSTMLEAFNQAVRASDLDRIASRRVLLDPLSRDQAERLVSARLSMLPAEYRSAHEGEPWSPLPADWFARRLARQTQLSPRAVITECARAFDDAVHGAASPAPPLEEALEQELGERVGAAKASVAPADLRAVFAKGLEVIEAVTGDVRVTPLPEPLLARVEGATSADVSVRNEVDGRSLLPRLKKLSAMLPLPEGRRLVILRDGRQPISRTAVKARELLAEMQSRGASVIEPSLEALAVIEALSSLLADARSGDLAHDGASVAPGSVLEWLRGLRAHPSFAPVEVALGQILESSELPPQPVLAKALDALSTEPVMFASDAAERAGCSEADLLSALAPLSDKVLVLFGPPPVLIRVAGLAAAEEP